MGINQEREELMKVYPNKKWREKVKKMSDTQVTAIYIRLKAEGKLAK